MPAEEQEPTARQAPPAKGSRKILLVIVILALLLAGGAGAAVFVLKDRLFGAPDQTEEALPEGSLSNPVRIGEMLVLEPFTINLAPGSMRKILKLTVTLEMKDAAAKKETQDRMPIIRDAFICYLTTKRDVDFDHDQEDMKAELLRRLKGIVGEGVVRRILFTERLMQ